MNTKALRQKILDLAIHGKLVPQAPNDEPASVLLERIRAEKERLVKEGKIKRPKKMKATSDKPHYENVPFEEPSSWVWTTVGEISQSILYGVSESAKSQGTYRLLRITDIQDNKVNWDTVPFTDYENEKAEAYLLKDGDILFARTGATVGKSYLVNNLKEKAIYASYLIRVQTNHYVLPAFVKYFFESGFYWEQVLGNSVGIGQPNVNGTILSNLELPIPPIMEQKRIVKELGEWLSIIDKIEESKGRIQKVISLAKSKVLDLAIHGKLVPQDPTDEPATELLKRINPKAEITCDNGHYQKLPEGWCECTLGSLFLFIRNGINIHQDKSKIGYPITRIETISSEFIDRSRMGYAAITEDNYSDYYLQKDDILMSHINSPIHVGKCALCDIKAGEKIIHGMNLLCLRPYPDIEAKFILMVFRSPYFKDEIRPFIKNAVNQASINIRNLSSVLLHLPPVSEQHRIVAKIEEIFAQLDAIEASLLPT